jgi:hypothetical protein
MAEGCCVHDEVKRRAQAIDSFCSLICRKRHIAVTKESR